MIILEFDLETKNLLSVRETTRFHVKDVVTIQRVNNVNVKNLVDGYIHDYYRQDSQARIYSPIHFHDDHEIRLIISGKARFFVPKGDKVIVVNVSSMDRIDLEPNIHHWYQSSGELEAIRVFGADSGYCQLYKDYSAHKEFYEYMNPDNMSKLYA